MCETISYKLFLGDILVKKCVEILNLIVNDEGEIISNNIVLKSHDYLTILIEEPIIYKKDRINGILFFGDGTIQFHLEKECISQNWAVFPIDLIKKIMRKITENKCRKFV